MERSVDRKLVYVRFLHPAAIKGLGMVDHLDCRSDPETKAPITPGVSMTWLGTERLLRVSTPAGESIVFEPNLASAEPVYEDRASAALKAKK
jgi:hypothetical protein